MSDRQQRTIPTGALVFGFSFVAGVVIWWVSLGLTGQREPWDSDGVFYVGAMVGTGFVCGALAPRRLWQSWAGMYVGQVVGTLVVNPQLGPLAPLGWFCFLPVICLATLAGAATTAVLRMTIAATIKRRRHAESPPD